MHGKVPLWSPVAGSPSMHTDVGGGRGRAGTGTLVNNRNVVHSMTHININP